jgi:acetoin utilization protein AcuB
LRLGAEPDASGELGLDELVQPPFDLSPDTAHREVVFSAAVDGDRFADDEAQRRAMRTSDAWNGDRQVEASPARVRVTDDAEDVVAADAGEGNERDSIADRSAHEAVTVAPEEPVPQLSRLDRLAQTAGQNEHELAGRQQRIDVLRRAVDDSECTGEPSEDRDSPPEVLAESPHGASRPRADACDGERGVPSEGVIRDEKRSAVGEAIDLLHVDAELASHRIDGSEKALAHPGRKADERVLFVGNEAVECHDAVFDAMSMPCGRRLAAWLRMNPTRETVTKAKRRKTVTIADVMTPQPLTIGRDQKLVTAHKMMAENGVRHLPVLERGDLVGVVSQRDLYFVETIAGVDKLADKVEDAMTIDARKFDPETPLTLVAREMFEHKLGCAVVVERDRVVGIFTAVDALRILAQRTTA